MGVDWPVKAMSANKRPSTSSLRRYLTSRPYLAVADIRRRFGLDPEAMSVVSRNGTTAYIGLPEREATKLQDLWQRDEVGVELSVEVKAPVVVGVYPMRIARFVIDQTATGQGIGHAEHDRGAPHRESPGEPVDAPLSETGRHEPSPTSNVVEDPSGMRVAAVTSDLMVYSRIHAAASAAGGWVQRMDTPADLHGQTGFDLVLVDWSARGDGWASDLASLRTEGSARVILFGQHTDLGAHAAAREADLGPMWARSRLINDLPTLLEQRV
jgi:hypothetical protein